MKRGITWAVVALTTLIVTAGLAAPANAATLGQAGKEPRNAPDAAAVLAASDLSPAEIQQAKSDLVEVRRLQEVAVSEDADGNITLDATAAKSAHIDQRIIDEYAYGLSLIGGTSTGTGTTGLSERVAAAPLLQALASSACRGKNASGTAVWGPYVQLDSCNTARVIGALTGGGGVAGITAILSKVPGVGTATAIITGILAIGAGAISICSADGNGVVLRLLWIGTPYCTGP